MLKSVWRTNLLSAIAANAQSIGLRYNSTSLYEPIYLDVSSRRLFDV